MGKENIISIKNLTKKYSLYNKVKDRFFEAVGVGKISKHTDFYALNGINFEVYKGETVGIIGTNGSGKSTLLKIITGVLECTEGDVIVKGKVSALLELGAGFNQEYTGRENIFLNGRLMGYPRKEMEERFDAIVEFADIGEFIDQPVKNYSSGMFARLAFAVAINVEPEILIVDEALSVGDIFFQNKCFKKFEELKEKNVTILFVSHDISSVRQMCQRVLWIEKGNQKIFDNADVVCDMYMDEKRMSMNSLTEKQQSEKTISNKEVDEHKIYPAIGNNVEDRFGCDDVNIISAFFTDMNDNITKSLVVDLEYKAHVVFNSFSNKKDIIVGFVLENNKGLPLFDINNYINQKETIIADIGKTIEIIYKFKMPRLLRGTYLLSAAVAEGTQEANQILTWLHGIDAVEIINMGYNSSYIEIPAEIEVTSNDSKNIELI